MGYAAVALIAILASPADVGRRVALPLPHELRDGETVWLEVKVGVIERGADVAIETDAGELFGVISPIRSGHPAGIYPVAVPASAIFKNRVIVRVVLNDYQRPKRAPTLQEVPRIRVRITGGRN